MLFIVSLFFQISTPNSVWFTLGTSTIVVPRFKSIGHCGINGHVKSDFGFVSNSFDLSFGPMVKENTFFTGLKI